MKMKILYKLIAPLSQIGESASTGSYFQTILTSSGKLPVITGNSIRGTIRNYGAMHLLDLLQIKLDKEIFHIFFSGGNLADTMKNDLQKARLVRQYFPLLSLLGGGLGDMILAGKTHFSFVFPVCRESRTITKIDSDISWHKLIEEIEFSRMDDSKNDNYSCYITDLDTEGKTTQMRYSVQYLAIGTDLVQEIILQNCTDLELGAFYASIKKWFTENPVMGGMGNKGFGAFEARIENGIELKGGEVTISPEWTEKIQNYETFLQENDIANYLEILKKGKEEKKNAKIKKSAIKDNSNIT